MSYLRRLGSLVIASALIAGTGLSEDASTLTAENGAEVKVYKDLSYYDGADRDPDGFQTLDLYVPKGADHAPVLIFVHGGGWSYKEGDPHTRGRLGPHNPFFASHGVIVASISYRLSPAYKHPAHVEDVARAFAWTKANVAKYGGDPGQIFLTGHSAGGHLVALVVADPKYLAAHQLSAADVRGVMPISGTFTVGEKGDRLDKIWGTQEAADDASPTNHIRAGLPPFLFFAGDQGQELERAEKSKAYAERLKEKGVSAEFVPVKDRDHSTIVTKLGAEGDLVAERMLGFVREHAAPARR